MKDNFDLDILQIDKNTQSMQIWPLDDEGITTIFIDNQGIETAFFDLTQEEIIQVINHLKKQLNENIQNR